MDRFTRREFERGLAAPLQVIEGSGGAGLPPNIGLFGVEFDRAGLAIDLELVVALGKSSSPAVLTPWVEDSSGYSRSRSVDELDLRTVGHTEQAQTTRRRGANLDGRDAGLADSDGPRQEGCARV